MKETKKYPKNENDRKVIEAFYELNSIVSTMSIGEMKEHYYKTTDQIALEKTEAKKKNELKKKKKQKDDDKDKFNSSVENHKDLVTITPTSSSTIKQKYYNLTSIAICSFTVEKLVFTRSYNVTILLPTNNPLCAKSIKSHEISKNDIQIKIHHLNYNNNGLIKSNIKVMIRHHSVGEESSLSSTMVVASIFLPDKIVHTENDLLSSCAIYTNYNNEKEKKETFLVFRAMYDNDDDRCNIGSYLDEPLVSNTKLTNIQALNHVQCRFCNLFLRTSNSSNGSNAMSQDIKTVCQLPNGYWDEITDYLTCYEGQATINFASTGNKIERGVVFEDESIIVMNKQDLSNICILAIDGYGEKDTQSNTTKTNDNENDNNFKTISALDFDKGVLFRGRRSWRDSVGGATVCCNQCCSILGYASLEEPDSCRLLKHRLCAKEERKKSSNTSDTETIDYFASNTCSTFIACELTRYAESQAVFTFMIFNGDSNGKILLLKLLSWNTLMVISKRKENNYEDQEQENQFERVAKVIYEEIDNPSHNLFTSDNSDVQDPMNFTWGGLDLCCPPTDQGVSNQSSTLNKDGEAVISSESTACVEIHLPGDEWVQLKEALCTGSTFIPKEIAKVTIQLKLGNEEGRDSASMSVLQLSRATAYE